MPTPSRRDFLRLTASSVAFFAGSSSLWLSGPLLAAGARREFLMFCDTDERPKITETPPQIDHGTVKGLDVASGEIFAIDIPFFGHTVIQNPAAPHQFVIMQKWGKQGALIDTQTHKIVSLLEPMEGYEFLGHGSYTQDGAFLIASENTPARDGGSVSVRDAKTMKIVRSISSHGAHPHECRLLKDGKTILIANQGIDDLGVAPSLTWADYDTGKLLHKIDFEPPTPAGELDKNFKGHFSHFDVSHDGWVCCGGGSGTPNATVVPNDPNGPRAIVGFVSPDAVTYYPKLPPEIVPQMLGEALSVSVLGETGLAAFTIPDANLCLIFDYKTQKLEHMVYTSHAKGVLALHDTPDAGHGIILLSQYRLSKAPFTSDQKLKTSVFNAAVHGVGSHLSRRYI